MGAITEALDSRNSVVRQESESATISEKSVYPTLVYSEPYDADPEVYTIPSASSSGVRYSEPLSKAVDEISIESDDEARIVPKQNDPRTLQAGLLQAAAREDQHIVRSQLSRQSR